MGVRKPPPLAEDVQPAVANTIAGERCITLGGAAYVLRPTWDAVQEVEQATGVTCVELGWQAERLRLRAVHAAAIVGACVRAQGRATDDKAMAHFSDKRLGELMYEADGGLLAAAAVLAPLLAGMVSGEYSFLGHPKIGTTMT